MWDLWEAAGWYEREAHDLFGVVFDGNDDLAPLLLYDEFEGHPMRKDFPTTGYVEVRYDDGFAAWVNGVPVARDNVPGGELSWNSSAPSSRPDSQAVRFNVFDLGAYAGTLRKGRNILALQGLNRASTNRDFLLQARLSGEEGELLMPPGHYFRVRVVE